MVLFVFGTGRREEAPTYPMAEELLRGFSWPRGANGSCESKRAFVCYGSPTSLTHLLRVGRFSGKPASGHTPCDLLLEYLDHVKDFPTPMRMVKGHTHSLLGAWFKEHWDLRDRLNIDKSISMEKIREIAVELKQRIVACGRDHPVPRLTDRAIARREEQLKQVRGGA